MQGMITHVGVAQRPLTSSATGLFRASATGASRSHLFIAMRDAEMMDGAVAPRPTPLTLPEVKSADRHR